MLTDILFNRVIDAIIGVITRLLHSRLARGYVECHGACEVAAWARLGPLRLNRNDCFVLDHEDAAISVDIPIRYSKGGCLRRARLHISYRVCRGTELVRQAGLEVVVRRPQPRVVYGRGNGQSHDEGPIPF